MQRMTYTISKEEYDKALKDGATSIIGIAEKMGYGVYGAKVYESNGQFYLSYDRGDSCD